MTVNSNLILINESSYSISINFKDSHLILQPKVPNQRAVEWNVCKTKDDFLIYMKTGYRWHREKSFAVEDLVNTKKIIISDSRVKGDIIIKKEKINE